MSNTLYLADFVLEKPGSTPATETYASFSGVQTSLAAGKPVGDVEPAVVQDVNAEANVLVALICHADHAQPKKVCGRTVIKRLLRDVR